MFQFYKHNFGIYDVRKNERKYAKIFDFPSLVLKEE